MAGSTSFHSLSYPKTQSRKQTSKLFHSLLDSYSCSHNLVFSYLKTTKWWRNIAMLQPLFGASVDFLLCHSCAQHILCYQVPPCLNKISHLPCMQALRLRYFLARIISCFLPGDKYIDRHWAKKRLTVLVTFEAYYVAWGVFLQTILESSV